MKQNVTKTTQDDPRTRKRTEDDTDPTLKKESIRHKEELERTNRRAQSKDMVNRARKGYHHDGPGGSYGGY
ncbi:MAG TPA: hypothetical protein VHK91_05545 [Flavisolibacter sp.]|nr:hypothetical protein [Flavisolibacter sp.]